MSEIDWDKLRSEYESGMSLRALAAKYGVSKSVIGERKHKEQWKEAKRTRTISRRVMSHEQVLVAGIPPPALPAFAPEQIAIGQLHPHPRNYQTHPEDELVHIEGSLRENGFYKNVVIASDNTILAGHGVVLAAQRIGHTHIPVIRMRFDKNDPRARKILAGDNEIRHLAEVDDRALTELLKELADEGDLLGTGYDDMMLANLLFVTRPASEIADLDAAAQWVGLPEYDMEGEHKIQIIVNFVNEEDKKAFCHLLALDPERIAKEGTGKSVWWPKPREHMDSKSVHFVSKERGDD